MRAAIVTSFGISNPELRSRTIDSFESDVAKEFPGHSVRRAFTSSDVIRRVERREGVRTDTLEEALSRALEDGFDEASVLPTQIVPGHLYEDARRIASGFAGRFRELSISPPLISSEEDAREFVSKLPGAYPAAFGSGGCLVLMSHGAGPGVESALAMLRKASQESHGARVLFVNPSGAPSTEEALSLLEGSGVERVSLAPLMFEAGYHARRDMAAPKGSLRSVFEESGYSVSCIMEGLSEIPAYRRMLLSRMRLKSLRLRCGRMKSLYTAY